MQQKLPNEWIEKIFMKLHARFGNQFLDKFSIGQIEDGEDVGITNAKDEWAIQLGKLTPERLKKGLSATFDYPPSCDEFKKACAPIPASHRQFVELPRPKPSADVQAAGLKKMRAVLGAKA